MLPLLEAAAASEHLATKPPGFPSQISTTIDTHFCNYSQPSLPPPQDCHKIFNNRHHNESVSEHEVSLSSLQIQVMFTEQKKGL